MGWETGTRRKFKFDPNSTENEGRFRLFDPKKIDKDSYFRRNSSTPGVSYVMGKAGGKTVIQAVRFDKERYKEIGALRWWEDNYGRNGLVFSDERKKEAMNRVAVAKELVAVAKFLMAGYRVEIPVMLPSGVMAIGLAYDGNAWYVMSQNEWRGYKDTYRDRDAFLRKLVGLVKDHRKAEQLVERLESEYERNNPQ